MPDRAKTTLACLLVLGFVAWFWVRGERFIAANGPTFDEGVHLTAGYAYWTTGDFGVNAEDPPLLKLLWALPAVVKGAPPIPAASGNSPSDHWHLSAAWLEASGSPQALLASARRVNLGLGCCLVLLVGWCAYRVWGSRAAAVAASVFAATDPTLLSLSCILSTDLGLSLFALSTCYLLWEYVAAPSRGRLAASGISLGLMLASKFSALGIVVGLGVAGLAYILRGGRLALPGKEQEGGFRPAVDLAFRLAAIAIATVAVTYAGIHFDEWGKGLKFQLTRASHGDSVFYLHGQLSRQGWFHYFLVALAIKLPLGLLAAGLVSGVIRTPARNLSLKAVWLAVPPLVFFALASYSRIDMGIRVVLPVLPFIYLLAAALAHGIGSSRPAAFWRIPVLAGCLGWCLWVAAATSPHELCYTNELANLRPGDAPALADSNLDWGQGLPALKTWMTHAGVDHIYLAYFGTDGPEAYGIRYQQLPGYGRLDTAGSEPVPANVLRHVVAVSTNHLYGLFLNDPQLYAFLRDRPPLTVLDGSIRVFDLTDDLAAIGRLQGMK